MAESFLDRWVPSISLLKVCSSATFLSVCVGLAAVLFALFNFARAESASGLLLMTAGVLLMTFVIWVGMRISSNIGFLTCLVATWVSSRIAIVLLFQKFVLAGDEQYFHDFVGKLVSALASGNVAALSNIYDYPVWLSRAFPLYLPLALAFGRDDAMAARYMNVLLGASQVLILFFIAKMIAGPKVARLTCLLLLVFPYHCLNVLSYDPQVAGTFFLLLSVFVFLKLILPRQRSKTQLVSLAVLLASSLLFAGIQRGGIDLLLIAVMVFVTLFLVPFSERRVKPRALITIACSVVLIWLPCRTTFDYWIGSHDSYHLRTHALGFMTRGWNLETSGEYLPLYEQLDAVSPQSEKKRLLAAILVTEFAKEPVRALVYLPAIKVAKLFAIGYASTAEVGLQQGGYIGGVNTYRGLRSMYAPVILSLAAYGLLLSFNRRKTMLRLMLPAILIAFSCAGIVLLWETSPRYSHPFHFALLIFAAYGLLGLNHGGLQSARESTVPILSRDFLLISCWIAIAIAVVVTCRMCKSYWLLDPRSLTETVNQKQLPIVPITPSSKPWEGQIEIPRGTALPAQVEIALPNASVVHLWLPEANKYQVEVNNSGLLPPAVSGRIVRAMARASESNKLILKVRSTEGPNDVSVPLRIGLGFILPE